MSIKVGFVSLGCPKNLVNTETMLARLVSAGFEIVAEDVDADVIVVNTCAFIESAKKEAIDNILDVAWLKENHTLKGIVVAGCLPERYRDEVMKELPEVDAIIGVGSIDDICEAVTAAYEGRKFSSFGDKNTVPLGGERVITTPEYFAYLQIAEGCDNCCSYCAIPAIRGRFRSRKMENIIEEAKSLAAAGVKELAVIAQDITRYGTDLYGGFMLAKLLRKLCRIDGIEWIRLLYCYPECMTDELIDTVAGEDKICKYIDLPLQHADAEVLKRMNRTGDEKSLLSLVEKLRERIPGVIIRTTVMVGFPGETQENFETLSRFVNEARFDRLGCFAFSPEEGTAAAEMDGQLEPEVKNRRAELIMQQQYEIFEEKQKEKIGRVFKVIVDGFDEDNLFYTGRTYMDCLEIDSIVIISTEEELLPGEFVNVKIIATDDCDLVGEVI